MIPPESIVSYGVHEITYTLDQNGRREVEGKEQMEDLITIY